ncbi:MAG: DNA polymerase III subunit alpha [Paludibacteraceae bacterium]|nr:DNA polymerase III subunit alpha [Paludibacteraceae bacterium]
MAFTHLHVHSHFSILDGMSKIQDLIDKCIKNKMYAMALTDHGNMFGIKELLDKTSATNKKFKEKRKDLTAQISAIEDGSLEKKIKERIEGLENQLKEADSKTKKSLEEEIQQLKEQLERIADGFLKNKLQKDLDAVPKDFKAIVGVEAYCARRSLYDKDKELKFLKKESGKETLVDIGGYHLILLAKDKVGYKNLCKLVSISWIDGIYRNPRIDKKILEEYHEGLICCSACLGGEIPQLIMQGEFEKAEESIMWFKSIFGDDYYLELQRHQPTDPDADQEVFPRQQYVNKKIIELARKTNTKLIATNDVHFVEESHAKAHDRLICLSTGHNVSDTNRLRYTRQEWLKTPEEMAEVFSDIPEALENTQEIADKCTPFSIDSPPIMPKFDIPVEFGTEEEYRKKFTEKDLFDEFTQNEKHEVVMSEADAKAKIEKLGGYDKLYRIKLEADYLAKVAWEGAHERYGEVLNDKQKEQIEFELYIMKTMGFPGYFLIVQDFIQAARNMGVSVGPGRGSAAGSVVAYCLKITNVDPMKYDLLFERFLNPDRISLPDIDVDFDDDGRELVLDWVSQKYGMTHVAHIITYGTMATKSSIKDVGRVQEVPLATVNQLVKFIPDKFSDNIKDENGKTPKVKIKNCLKYIPELQQAAEGADKNVSSMLLYAQQLEDTNRQLGIHACGVIIGADDLTKFAPLATVTDKKSNKQVMVTQYDGHVVESVGLIKMDFLGLSTLSIIKEAIRNVKKARGIDIDIDAIPIDDPEVYKLYARGETVGIFQFESAGMQKYLRELQPTMFGDLIAMNALYRPGPMDYIPDFIARKADPSKITYDIPIMEKYLKDTYGITVYQEQVMLLSRLLAGFTRGQSDALRKAMGKKLKKVLDELKPKFINGGIANGHDPQILEKIWADWEKFASYAFNKSHATCYAWVSYQTAYLKTHYPAEYMAGLLTRSKDTPADVSKFMDECKRMRLNIKGPDINESHLNFAVNANGEIRFGLGAIKGVGEGAVDAIVRERENNGPYTSVYNFMERISLRDCNKKTIESLTQAGAFDSLESLTREQILGMSEAGHTMLDELIIYGNKVQQSKAQSAGSTLFGDELDEIEIGKPQALPVGEFSLIDRLNKEKDLIGIYLSSHPLDKYRMIIKFGCNASTKDLDFALNHKQNKAFVIGGMVSKVKEGFTKTNNPYGILTLEDYSGTCEVPFFGRDYSQYSGFLKEGTFILLRGIVQRRENNFSKFNKQPAPTTQQEERWEVKINNIDHLEEVNLSSLLNKVAVTIHLDKLDEMVCKDLISMIKSHPGKTPLYVKVHDNEEIGGDIQLYSRGVSVGIDQSFMDDFEKINANNNLDLEINEKSCYKVETVEVEDMFNAADDVPDGNE